MNLFASIILFNFLVLINSCSFSDFPECGCSTTGKKNGSGKKVYCHKAADLHGILTQLKFSENIQAIDFSGNDVTEITSDFFPETNILKTNIKTLNLANNKISFIAPSAFKIFQNLTQLNLSYNELGRINKNMFLGLDNLQELYLSFNLFPIIPGDAFTPLISLVKLDLLSDYLICDCLMSDFITWFRAYKNKRSNPTPSGQKVKVKLLGTCRLPSSFRGKQLKQLRPKKLPCDTLTELPYFEMQPSSRQVVFEGDSISLNCEGTDIKEAKVTWSRNGKPVGNASTEIFEENTTRFYNKTIVSSNFQLKEINQKFAGTWRCSITSSHAKVFQQIQLIVLKKSATYCRATNVTNNLGLFMWPATVTDATTFLTCHQPKDNSMSHKASKTCDSHEGWRKGNYSRCQFIDQIARIIKTTLLQDITSTDALTKCQDTSIKLGNSSVESPLGVEMIVELMQKCSGFLSQVDAMQMSSVVVRLASISTTGPHLPTIPLQTYPTILNLLKQSLYLLFNVVEGFDKEFENIFVIGKTLSSETQSTTFNISTKMNKKENKYIKSQTKTLLPQPFIRIPNLNIEDGRKYNLLITVYRNGNLFQSAQTTTLGLSQYPLEAPESSPLGVHVLISDIYSISFNGDQLVMTSQPVVYVFQTKESVSMFNGKHFIGIWNGSHWGISHDDCRFNRTNKQQNINVAVVECKILSTIAIFQDITWEEMGQYGINGSTQMLHPSIYVGSTVLSSTLVFILFTYITFNNILITRDTRHMILNTCLHLLISVIAFTVGIWRVDFQVLCYVSGILLHYSSLSVLLWVLLSSRNICKDIMTSQQPPSLDPKPPRPLLRFYLIGCGIPLIICGITAAAKLENYNGDGHKYCWLSWETSLYAFYVAAAVIAIACVLVLLKILATLNCNLEVNKANGKQNRNNFDEQTPLHYMGNYEGTRVKDDIRPPLNQINNEQSFRTRLRGVAMILGFFIATWVAAAMTVASPYIQATAAREISASKFNRNTFSTTNKGTPANLSEIFSFVFAFLSCSTSVLLFYQHIWSRNDVKQNWKMMSCKKSRVAANKLNEGSVSNIIFNQKTSREPKRENTSTTVATEQTTETNLLTTAPSSNQNTSHNRSCNHNSTHNRTCQSHVSPNRSCHSHLSPNRSCHSHMSPNRSCNREDKSHHGSHRIAHSHGGNLYHSEKDHLIAGSFENHHYGSQQYYNHSRSGDKPIKLTNLQHDSSMTEHSFDNETHNNMHTLPTMLQHTQPKLDNSVLYHRYQKMRKALDAKKNKQKKLAVLREYAQDPITSNEEGEKLVNINLTQEPENNNDVLKDYDLNFKDTDQKYRPLLISSNKQKHPKRNGNTAPHHRRRLSRQQNSKRYPRSRIKQQTNKTLNHTEKNKSLDLNETNKDPDLDETDKDVNLLGVNKNYNFVEENKSHNYMTANDLSSQLFLPISVTSPVHPLKMTSDLKVGEQGGEELAYASVRNETSV